MDRDCIFTTRLCCHFLFSFSHTFSPAASLFSLWPARATKCSGQAICLRCNKTHCSRQQIKRAAPVHHMSQSTARSCKQLLHCLMTKSSLHYLLQFIVTWMSRKKMVAHISLISPCVTIKRNSNLFSSGFPLLFILHYQGWIISKFNYS